MTGDGKIVAGSVSRPEEIGTLDLTKPTTTTAEQSSPFSLLVLDSSVPTYMSFSAEWVAAIRAVHPGAKILMFNELYLEHGASGFQKFLFQYVAENRIEVILIL